VNFQSSARGVALRAPAKLNLFLELLARREDGYHDIDTVMVPIDCYDTLVIRTTNHAGIRIATHWWPSRQHWITTLGGEAHAQPLLDVPNDERNLIHRAMVATAKLCPVSSGFDVEVRKRIPAGAGMGGASSDAAAAIRGVAKLGGLADDDPRLWQIAAQIGSDVPFFLGCEPKNARLRPDRVTAMRATGRGEILSPVPLAKQLRLIVVYPATSLSTAKVYSQCVVPSKSIAGDTMVDALTAGTVATIGQVMLNRLTAAALKISPMVRDLLEVMWRCELPHCQLTGSGSACFSLLEDSHDAGLLIELLRTKLQSKQLNAHIIHAKTIAIPQRVLALHRDDDEKLKTHE
jgi:4-diphosphocytidyl-2-C-methyl-D-erythritol kinase